MLRVILVASPQDEQVARIATALEGTPLTELYAPASMSSEASTIGAVHSLAGRPDERFQTGSGALEAITALAETTEGTVAVVASAIVVREVIVHALDAPVDRKSTRLNSSH